MRIKVKLSNNGEHIELPVNYQRIVQGLIYHLLDNDRTFQNFLHQHGYKYEKEVLKRSHIVVC